MINIRYHYFTAWDMGVEGHAQTNVKKLGIKYEESLPQRMGDQWWFFNCTDVPEELPKYLTILDLSPLDAVGHGLTEERAKQLMKGNNE